MSTTNILDLNNRIDALEKISHNVEPIQQQIDELKAWTDPGTKEASGNPIILTDGAAFNAEGLAVTCNPKQNLHGYDHPWAGGAGKNKYNSETKTVGQTLNTSNGGATNNNNWEVSDYIPASDGDITLAWDSQTNFYQANFCAYDANRNFIAGSGTAYTGYAYSHTFTAPSGTAFVRFSWAFIVSGTEYPRTNVRVSIGATDLGYSPYSNECPITGYTECVAEVKDEEETTQDTATITFGQTVYGGSVDFKTGKVTVTHASIASYNGESINEPWLSSKDEYVSGTTPTTGAQVVYPLATPTELTLTPAELELLKGYNYITSNGTTIDLTYQPDNLKADILLTVSQLYGSKISIFDGILTGGDTGQVLTKTSDDNYDATWETLPATRTTTRKTTKEESK